MSLVIADSHPESLTLIAAQHEDWIIQQAITLLENRVFKAGPALGSPAAVLCLALLAPVAVAADVLVVTDSRHPVPAPAPAGVRVIELDQPVRIEAELTARLPADPAQAEALVRQRLLDGGADLQRRIGQAYQGVADAWGLGIAKIPAVVVDRRYVVYGKPDVAHAVARIDAYRSTRP